MNNGLLAPGIVSFVFTPLVITIALLLLICWKRMKDSRDLLPAPLSGLDTPGLLLASAVRQMPEERREWGAAMLAELSQIHDQTVRWRFALGCVRVALFSPRRAGRAGMPRPAIAGRNLVCGMLAVALPPLGLPLIYFAAVIVEAIGGSPFTQASRWSNPDAVIVVVNIIVKLLFFSLLAGLPLGLAGWLRRERLRWLSGFGVSLSICIFGYFLLVMHFLAGED